MYSFNSLENSNDSYTISVNTEDFNINDFTTIDVPVDSALSKYDITIDGTEDSTSTYLSLL